MIKITAKKSFGKKVHGAKSLTDKIQKLEGRDKIFPKAIATKVNEIIDYLNDETG